MNLTKDFLLSEFVYSKTAVRNNINNIPNELVICNLKSLCIEVLQPLRDRLRVPVIITSGYRSRRLNDILGGVSNSQHLKGQAADFVVPHFSLREVFNVLCIHFTFDQLIYEMDRWIHVSYCRDKNRNEVLEAYSENGIVRYRNLSV